MVTYLQKSKTCHSFKDLEKALPTIASISGMQLKDYLQNLQDDNRINVEKIGSGNWYWCFPSQAEKNKQDILSGAQAEHNKASAAVAELRQRLADAAAVRQEDEEMLDGGGESREELMTRKAILEADLADLRRKLESYSDNDPTELERQKTETEAMTNVAEEVTDEIQVIEDYLKKQLDQPDAVAGFRMTMYGDEWDPEEFDFRPI